MHSSGSGAICGGSALPRSTLRLVARGRGALSRLASRAAASGSVLLFAQKALPTASGFALGDVLTQVRRCSLIWRLKSKPDGRAARLPRGSTCSKSESCCRGVLPSSPVLGHFLASHRADTFFMHVFDACLCLHARVHLRSTHRHAHVQPLRHATPRHAAPHSNWARCGQQTPGRRSTTPLRTTFARLRPWQSLARA